MLNRIINVKQQFLKLFDCVQWKDYQYKELIVFDLYTWNDLTGLKSYLRII